MLGGSSGSSRALPLPGLSRPGALSSSDQPTGGRRIRKVGAWADAGPSFPVNAREALEPMQAMHVSARRAHGRAGARRCWGVLPRFRFLPTVPTMVPWVGYTK